jgi:hypothetical protein
MSVLWITGQLAAAAGAAASDFDSPLDFEAPLDVDADVDVDDESLEDSVEVPDFFFSPFDELLLVLALLSVR